MPVWVAQDQGIFAQHGLDVEVKTILAGPTMISALNSQSIDAMLNGATIAVTASATGQPIKMITPTIPKSIYNLIASKEVMDSCPYVNEPYPKPILCAKGKRIGVVALGTESHIGGITVLEEAGLKESDVSWVPASAGEMIGSSMQAGQIDLFFGEDTAATYATEVIKVGSPLVDLKHDGPFVDWFGNGVWALEPQLQRSPDKYQKFTDAISDAITWINDPANSTEARAIFKKNSPNTSDATVDAVIASSHDYFGTTATCSSIETITTWLTKTNQLAAGKGPATCHDISWQTVSFS
ncbi:ABC transporter substrate-binding protein [Prescottella agglutinans]|uniref:ABC transporter substrate-binding protein n=2 Tax=Prescottella agglutinans TaxID=1644129 RepID=A0A438BA28_9NOCA|nr:ABC transporter substrate-binding protein [Prescottella agglutinans]